MQKERLQPDVHIAAGDVSNDITAESFDVAGLRQRLGMSQSEFSRQFHIHLDTLKGWEQRRRSPDRTALTLLRLIEKMPNQVRRALSGHQK